jgi:hypothetical protein
MTVQSADGSVAFFSPSSQLFLVVAPHDPPLGTGHVVFSAYNPQEYEKLYLEPVEPQQVPAYFRDSAPFLDKVLDPTLTETSITSFLLSAPPSPVTGDVMNAAGMLLSDRELRALGRRITRDPEVLSRLKAHYPQDLTAQRGLERFAKWLAWRDNKDGSSMQTASGQSISGWSRLARRGFGRRAAPTQVKDVIQAQRPSTFIREAGPEFDSLDEFGAWASFRSLPHASYIAARRHIEPRQRACVLATARNEGLYLLEWLAHHKALGFKHFFIYSNNNLDGSDDLLRALTEAGEIVWTNNIVGSGTKPQWKAYNHALQFTPEILDFDWTLVIDLDEYFSLNRDFFLTIDHYLDWAERTEVDVICFNWFVVGSNGETHWRDAPLRKRFPSSPSTLSPGSAASRFIKSMFRTNRFPVSMPHHPIGYREDRFIMKASSSRPFIFDPAQGQGMSVDTDCRLAWISHYFYKSNEEFVFKFSRARGDDPATQEPEFSALTSEFIENFMGSSQRSLVVEGDSCFDKAVQDWVTRFLSHAPVQAAHRRIMQFYEGRLAALLPHLASSSAISGAGEVGQEFLRPLLARPPCRS